MAERTGLEPATSGVTGQHSNQLNYRSALLLFCFPIGLDLGENKASSFWPEASLNGGADGTRTRDLRRDRPAF
ncbi:hypothetical protein SMG44B_30316 [Stenotrophomonas maltophilia]